MDSINYSSKRISLALSIHYAYYKQNTSFEKYISSVSTNTSMNDIKERAFYNSFKSITRNLSTFEICSNHIYQIVHLFIHTSITTMFKYIALNQKRNTIPT